MGKSSLGSEMHCATDSVSWSLAIIRESVLVPGMSQETARQISRLKQFPRFAPEGKILHQYWLALEAITGSTDAIYPHSATSHRLGRTGARHHILIGSRGKPPSQRVCRLILDRGQSILVVWWRDMYGQC